MIHLNNWQLAVVGLPLFFFRSSCAYLQHNQGHLPAFWSKPLNWIYDIELGLMTGYVTPVWELHHARGHHRYYLTPEKDPARIQATKTAKPMARWWYCVRGNLTILQDSWRLANAEVREGRADLRGRFLLHTAVVTALSVALLVANPWAFLWMMLVPNVLIGLGVWWISYDHHRDLPLNTHGDGSHTHLGRRFNLLTFNIGHHAAHHEKPTLHWSLLPERSAQLLHRLLPESVHGELEPSVTQIAQDVLAKTAEDCEAAGIPPAA
jgi:fatty acid desaturase